MPYYYRRRKYYNYRWRPKHRRNWFGRPFRRRFRRARRHRVRNYNKKLSKILIQEWQPPTIRKCTIKGKTCLVYFSEERLGNNSVMYENSYTPDHWPGGGGFSVSKYTLENLYDMHLTCNNWWTSSNLDLPLCRYRGCTLKFYKCEFIDYVVQIKTEFPATSNKLTYPSCQPQMMLMTPHRIIVPSQKTKRTRKPYKKYFIKPPPQLQTKWYFQVDLLKTALVQIHVAACSLSNYFLKPTDKSNTIKFTGLNTSLIQNRRMAIENNTHWYYKQLGTQKFYFYFYRSETDNQPQNASQAKLIHLCPLTQIRNYTPGTSYNEQNPTGTQDDSTIKSYFQNWLKYAGNPFHKENIENPQYIHTSWASPESIQNYVNNNTDLKNKTLNHVTANAPFTLLEEPVYTYYYYNPLLDTGQNSTYYILPVTDGDGWEPSSDQEQRLDGFPMWLGLFGFVDFQKKLQKHHYYDTNTVVVIKSTFIKGPKAYPIVPLNWGFFNEQSPYETQVLDADKTKWYPQLQYQLHELNKIIRTGPGTATLTDYNSENIQMFYKFHFKWGGSPARVTNIDNPAHQIQYPIPRNEHETNSLQSPATAPESVVYSFDFRHGDLTKQALTRITKDWQTKGFIDSFTDQDTRKYLKETFQQLEESEKTQIEKETEILFKLHQLRDEQQQLRERIISLMAQPS
nr:MAG: ORF1 [TTV-like mini virus]